MIYLDLLTLGHPADSHFHMIYNLIIFGIYSAIDFFYVFFPVFFAEQLLQVYAIISQNKIFPALAMVLQIGISQTDVITVHPSAFMFSHFIVY